MQKMIQTFCTIDTVDIPYFSFQSWHSLTLHIPYYENYKIGIAGLGEHNYTVMHGYPSVKKIEWRFYSGKDFVCPFFCFKS